MLRRTGRRSRSSSCRRRSISPPVIYRLRKSNSYLDITKEQIEKPSASRKNSVSDRRVVLITRSARFRFSLICKSVWSAVQFRYCCSFLTLAHNFVIMCSNEIRMQVKLKVSASMQQEHAVIECLFAVIVLSAGGGVALSSGYSLYFYLMLI